MESTCAELELDGDRVASENFPLSTLGPKLRELSKEIYGGKGFCLIRGLDLEKYSVEQYTAMYLGIQSYIASERGRQDRNGNILGKLAHAPFHCVLRQSANLQASSHYRRQVLPYYRQPPPPLYRGYRMLNLPILTSLITVLSLTPTTVIPQRGSLRRCRLDDS